MNAPFISDEALPPKQKKNFLSVRYSYSKACFDSQKSTLEQVDEFLNSNSIFDELVFDLDVKFNVDNMIMGRKSQKAFGQSTLCGDSAIGQSTAFLSDSSTFHSGNIFKLSQSKNLNFKSGSLNDKKYGSSGALNSSNVASLSQFSSSFRSRSTLNSSSNRSNYFKLKLRKLRTKAYFRKVMNKFMLKISKIPFLSLESRNYLKMVRQVEPGHNSILKTLCNCISNFVMRDKLLKKQDELDQQVDVIKVLIQDQLDKFRLEMEDELRLLTRAYKRTLQEFITTEYHLEFQNQKSKLFKIQKLNELEEQIAILMLLDTTLYVKSCNGGKQSDNSLELDKKIIIFQFGLKPISTKIKGLTKILTPKKSKKKSLSIPQNCLDFTFHSPSVDGSFLVNPFEMTDNDFGNMSEIAVFDEENPSNRNSHFPIDLDIDIHSGSNYSKENSFKLELAQNQKESSRNSSPMKLNFDKEIYLINAIN